MAYRFLHTADLHLGKRLHGVDFTLDHKRFFEWLIGFVTEEEIDAVLISGDVFDLANPSSEARKLYYELLLGLNKVGCQVIVTGGNHDSPQVLNAPSALLQALNVSVIGGLPAQETEMIVPLVNKEGHEVARVAAVPYIREADIRRGRNFEGYDDRIATLKEGLKSIFESVAVVAKDQDAQIPLIGMGHLFAHGASTSESERDIQVGNLAGFEASMFPEAYAYLALGHIHRPQQVGGTGRIQYSGSPIHLSFSEAQDTKRVVIGTISGMEVSTVSVPIPGLRRLKRLKGNLEYLRAGLRTLERGAEHMPTLVELELVEEEYSPQHLVSLETMIDSWHNPGIHIIKYRAQFNRQVQHAANLYTSEQLQDLQPREVFQRRLAEESLDEKTEQLLLTAFDEVLEIAQQGEECA